MTQASGSPYNMTNEQQTYNYLNYISSMDVIHVSCAHRKIHQTRTCKFSSVTNI